MPNQVQSSNIKIEAIRHSLSHLMSMAITEKYPKAGLGVGPAVENGFYQDYDLPEAVSQKDFPWIEKKMRELAAKKIEFVKGESDFDSALEFYKHDSCKTEMINDLKAAGEKALSFYDSDWFHNLCAGPHVKNTSEINPDAFKLTKVAGAYWRGSEKNKMLTRIYGVAFETKKELEDYIKNQEEAEKRDHRKLGNQLGLWTFSEYVGTGLPLFTPKGALVRRLINEFVEDLQSQQGISQVWTPQIAKAELFKISGHYEKYKENMMRVQSNYSKEEFYLKPMNCPQHTQIYASQLRSHKDLPLRFSDFAMLYRDEKPGELFGLTRSRAFSQDDCHIFCREDQVVEEANKALAMTKKIMKCYGFSYKYRLSLRDLEHPEKYIGDPKDWEKAEKISEKILNDNKLEYFPGPGEAAFYGPKLDLIAKDSLGRDWQLSTLQIDFVMPKRFNLSYVDNKGKQQTPVMLHRAISGSPERLMAILIEHYNGAFPLWLSPVQVAILNITDKHLRYAEETLRELVSEGIRAEINADNTIGKRIREGELQKIPYLLIVGDKEMKTKSVAPRKRGKGDLGMMKLSKFVEKVKIEIEKKK